MWKRRVNMRFSPINSGIYHIYIFSLVFLPFQNSGDEMCNTRSFDPSELHTSTYLLHNTSIPIKPVTIVNNPLKAYSAPLSSPVADNSFPVKHCTSRYII